MKNIFRSISLVLCTVVLCGCHGTLREENNIVTPKDSYTENKYKSSFEVPPKFDTSKNYEVVFWAKNDTNKDQVAVYKKAISDFEKLYPNIKINMTLYTDYNRIYKDVITNIPTDTLPNICITYPDHIATYLDGNDIVIPLNDLINNSDYGLGGKMLKFDSPKKNEIVEKFLDECTFGEIVFGLPFMRSTEACYINKDYVEKLGYSIPESLTWDYIWEVSEAATVKDSRGKYIVNDQEVMIPFIYKSTDNMMIQMLKQKNAGYSNEYGDILIFNDTTEELLMVIADHTRSGAFSTFGVSSYPANYLNAGQCIFAIDSTAGATWMGQNAPHSDIHSEKFAEFETVVKPIPQFDTDNPEMISQGPSICIFNKDDPQEIMASWLFTQFLLTNDVQIGYSQTEGYLPVTSKAQDSKEYTEYISNCGKDNNLHYDIKIKAALILKENIGNTFVTPVFNGSASLRSAAGEMIESTVKSVRRKEKVDSAYINKMFDTTVSLKRLDESKVVSREEANNYSESEESTQPVSTLKKKAFHKEKQLPIESTILIISLILVWTIIIFGFTCSFFIRFFKAKRKNT